MANIINTKIVDSDLLSPSAQQRLCARITDASDDIAAVIHEIQTQLAELDDTDMSNHLIAQHTRLTDELSAQYLHMSQSPAIRHSSAKME